MSLLLKNARVISPGVDDRESAVAIEGDRMVATGPGAAGFAADEIIDCAGWLVLPGFIDIHTHGAAGHDICDGNPESVRRIAEAKLREGVTTFLPTTMTLPHDRLVTAARAVAEYRQRPEFARTPAMHIEGPFINPKCVGAQNPAFVRSPDVNEILALNAIAPVGIVSLAAEMPGGIECIRALSAAGIVPSLAHTAASFAVFKDAMAAGLRHLTHLGNQMTPLHHREIGIVGAAIVDPEVMIELICDTVHVCPEMIALIFAIKSPAQMMLITDSMAASGRGDGEFDLGGLRVTVRDGVARLDSGALAGSTLGFNTGLRHVHRITGAPLDQLVAATSWNQATSLKLAGLGRVEAGYLADLAVLDENFDVQLTIVDGSVRFRRR